MRIDRSRCRDKGKALAAVAAVLGLAALVAGQEQLTVTTFTPAPAMIVNGLTSTGPRHTILARDGTANGANVGIRLGAGVNPASPLDIGPQDGANEGGEVRLRGAGGNPYAYLDNWTGNLRVVTQNTGGPGETERARLDNNGRIHTTGDRTYLQGTDGAFHWIMSGGTTEGVDNALGFNPGAKTVSVGPGWTLQGSGVRAWEGQLSGSGWSGDWWIPLSFNPVAAMCSVKASGRFGSWCHPQCDHQIFPGNPGVAHFWVSFPYDNGCCQGFCGTPGWFFDGMVIGN